MDRRGRRLLHDTCDFGRSACTEQQIPSKLTHTELMSHHFSDTDACVATATLGAFAREGYAVSYHFRTCKIRSDIPFRESDLRFGIREAFVTEILPLCKCKSQVNFM